MDFQAHPIEIFWLLAAAGAVGGALHIVYLAIGDRAAAEYAKRLSFANADARLEMAGYLLIGEMFRFFLAALSFGGSLMAVFGGPGSGEDYAFFPEILGVVVVGLLTSIIIIIWTVFDLIVRRNLEQNGTVSRA